MVYFAAAGFMLAVFPIHVFNYIYINTEEKYASVNVTIFRFIRLMNLNTVKDKPGEMQINGKNKKFDPSDFNPSALKILHRICIYKIVQLSDFGMQKQSNAYAALSQYALTHFAYAFLKINGTRAKLRNYAIFNQSHSEIRYYAKAVTVINLIVVTKILFIILTEKLNERKIQKR